jgi:hypothetical protein
MAEFLGIAVFVSLVYLPCIEQVPFHGDESIWISRSHALEDYVSRLRRSGGGGFHPIAAAAPVSKYIIGIGRRLGGFGPSEVGQPWRWDLTYEENVRAGSMPSADLLWWSRLPMAVLGVISILLLSSLVFGAGGRLAGYLTAILCVINPFLSMTLRRAMTESPLLVWTMLSAGAGYLAARSWRRASARNGIDARRHRWAFLLWIAVLGACAGMAGGSKLNGFAAALAGVGVCATTAVLGSGGLPPVRAVALRLAGAAVCVICTFVVFVGVNPPLQRDPVRRTMKMLEGRTQLMRSQYQRLPQSQISGFRTRAEVVPQRVLGDYAAIRTWGAVSINGSLFIIGLGYLVYVSWRRRWLAAAGAESGLVLLWFAAAMSVPASLTPLDWDRYYLLPIFFTTAFIAVGLALLTTTLLKSGSGRPTPA